MSVCELESGELIVGNRYENTVQSCSDSIQLLSLHYSLCNLCHLQLLYSALLHQHCGKQNSHSHFSPRDIDKFIHTSCKILNYTNIVPNFPNAILDFPDRFSFPPLSKVPSRQSGSLCWVTDPLGLTPSSNPIHRRALLPLKHSHFHDRILSLHNHQRKMPTIISLIL